MKKTFWYLLHCSAIANVIIQTTKLLDLLQCNTRCPLFPLQVSSFKSSREQLVKHSHVVRVSTHGSKRWCRGLKVSNRWEGLFLNEGAQ